ncbi:hypothetical protein [Bradyrhizobium sp. 195]|uniref:hypothetical protein n=1 Tax=Bradyrhizobium sp. 195 TaxID=2782662 RepID=UPI002000D12D|nr:hypothetical protein [Bradyrhizobium sp. 195]UPK30820.1 hypothetical protein IVB26_20640 [Bradyrhizobium sp. 195]
MTPSRDISRLIEIMAALRTPVTGCPWDNRCTQKFQPKKKPPGGSYDLDNQLVN